MDDRLRDRLRPVWFCTRPKEVARVHDLRKDAQIAALDLGNV
jgi:hypothetical protein